MSKNTIPRPRGEREAPRQQVRFPRVPWSRRSRSRSRYLCSSCREVVPGGAIVHVAGEPRERFLCHPCDVYLRSGEFMVAIDFVRFQGRCDVEN